MRGLGIVFGCAVVAVVVTSEEAAAQDRWCSFCHQPVRNGRISHASSCRLARRSAPKRVNRRSTTKTYSRRTYPKRRRSRSRRGQKKSKWSLDGYVPQYDYTPRKKAGPPPGFVYTRTPGFYVEAWKYKKGGKDAAALDAKLKKLQASIDRRDQRNLAARKRRHLIWLRTQTLPEVPPGSFEELPPALQAAVRELLRRYRDLGAELPAQLAKSLARWENDLPKVPIVDPWQLRSGALTLGAAPKIAPPFGVLKAERALRERLEAVRRKGGPELEALLGVLEGEPQARAKGYLSDLMDDAVFPRVGVGAIVKRVKGAGVALKSIAEGLSGEVVDSAHATAWLLAEPGTTIEDALPILRRLKYVRWKAAVNVGEATYDASK